MVNQAPAGGARTWFSGRSAPEDQKFINPLPFIALGFLLFSPTGAVVLVASYVIFVRLRLSHHVITGTALIYCVPYFGYIAATSSFADLADGYLEPIRRFVRAIRDGQRPLEWIGEHWGYWLGTQFAASVAMGLILGSLWCTWKWVRRPAWQEFERSPGPLEYLRLRRWTANIAADKEGPYDGSTLGVTKYGERVVQTIAEAAPHTLVMGGSGAGKTSTLMVGVRDAIRRGEGVCIVDLKGGVDVPAMLAEWAERYGRRFLHWSITEPTTYLGPADRPASYDPVGRGDASRRKDLLIGSEKWDVEYYKQVTDSYLQNAFLVSDLTPDPSVDTLTNLANLLDVRKMRERCKTLFLATAKTAEGVAAVAHHVEPPVTASPREREAGEFRWWEYLYTVIDPETRRALEAMAGSLIGTEESERSAIRGMSHRVQSLRQSTAGRWLQLDPEGTHNIDLRRAADEGWVVVFSLDSSNYEATSAKVGGLVIQDLKTISSELRHAGGPKAGPFHVYVDEFSAMDSDNVIGLLAKSRDAQMPVTLATQALADLMRADPNLKGQLTGIVNCFIIHRANNEEDAEMFAGLTGKVLRQVTRYGFEMTSAIPGGMSTGAATGTGMVQDEMDHAVRGFEIQRLRQGECVYIAKSPDQRVVHPVKVIREDPKAISRRVANQSLAIKGLPAVERPVSVEVDTAALLMQDAWDDPVAAAPVDPRPAFAAEQTGAAVAAEPLESGFPEAIGDLDLVFHESVQPTAPPSATPVVPVVASPAAVPVTGVPGERVVASLAEQQAIAAQVAPPVVRKAAPVFPGDQPQEHSSEPRPFADLEPERLVSESGVESGVEIDTVPAPVMPAPVVPAPVVPAPVTPVAVSPGEGESPKRAPLIDPDKMRYR